jgi:7-carboxy-7-deazaguanine synthase
MKLRERIINIMYKVLEVFRSIQGEGIDTGKICTFVRFSGCNLDCLFCDTKMVGDREMSMQEIVSEVMSHGCENVVLTGGEPTIQDIDPIIDVLKKHGYRMGIETNGTNEIDVKKFRSISLSPKMPRSECKVQAAHSLKILWPYLDGVEADDWQSFDAEYKSIQIIDLSQRSPASLCAAMYAAQRLGPNWRVGIQVHKLLQVR